MDRYVICGGERLSGQVKISGAKNAVLPILAGTLMTKNAVLKNVPNLSDVAYTVEILENLGMNITRENDKMNIINSGIVILFSLQSFVAKCVLQYFLWVECWHQPGK